jgi:hypothetical protein
MKPYEDPNHPWNGLKYRSGQLCIERGCNNPAGTAWSPYWCQPCNAKRMNSIRASMEEIAEGLK